MVQVNHYTVYSMYLIQFASFFKKSRRVTSGHCRVEHAQLPVSSHGLHSNIRDTPLGNI